MICNLFVNYRSKKEHKKRTLFTSVLFMSLSEVIRCVFAAAVEVKPLGVFL